MQRSGFGPGSSACLFFGSRGFCFWSGRGRAEDGWMELTAGDV